MIRPFPVLLCALACAVSSLAQAPASEISKVDYYLREFESRIKFADGMLYELSKDDTRALEEVKKIAEKFPEDEKVKALVDRGKAAYKLTKGLHVDFTEEMLAYRKRGEKLGDIAKKAANDAWAAMEKDLAADLMLAAMAVYTDLPVDAVLEVKKGALDTLEQAFNTATGESLKTAILASVVVRKSEDVKSFRARFDSRIYKSRVDKVVDAQIEPDTSSLFHKCESVWEKALLKLVDDYHVAYVDYEVASEPAALQTLKFQAYYLKNCPAKALDAVFGKNLTIVQDAFEALQEDVEDDE
ncbi:MAG: hypothetical protein AAB074_21095 [Planctomycetota bacterium]